MLLSLGFFIPVFGEYLATGLVLKFPTLIVCGFVALAALISFFSGVILSTINQKNRQDFEMELHAIQREYNRIHTEE